MMFKRGQHAVSTMKVACTMYILTPMFSHIDDDRFGLADYRGIFNSNPNPLSRFCCFL